MNRKGFANILLIIIVIAAAGYLILINKLEPGGQTQNNTKVYRNSVMGFQLTFPNTWVLPSATAFDPSFISSEECNRAYGPNCRSLGIQDHSNDIFYKDLDTYLDRLNQILPNQDFVRFDSLIKGAVVIKHENLEGGDGGSYYYDVFFQSNNKRFIIGIDGDGAFVEKNILPTLMLQ